MKEILKSKGIIAFFIFVIAMAVISSNSLNAQKNVSGTSTNSQLINLNN